jgi:AFG3 family protein
MRSLRQLLARLGEVEGQALLFTARELALPARATGVTSSAAAHAAATGARLFSAAAATGSRPALAPQLAALPPAARALARGAARRRFSAEAPPPPPRRGWERFYPKGKARRPAGGREERAAGGGGGALGPGGWEAAARRGAAQLAPAAAVLALAATLLGGGRDDAREVSFQWFRTHLLARGAVERLEVANKQTVKVYVRAGAARGLAAGGGGAAAGDAAGSEMLGGGERGGLGALGGGGAAAADGLYKFYFNIGSVDAFEAALEEAQDALGAAPAARVPVTYTSEVSWQAEAWRLAPTLLLIGGYVWFTRRQMGGLMGGGGPGGARGIFNVGKASVTTVDKSAKGKVSFRDVAGCDEAKAEVVEFVNFLKHPGRYRELGAKIPRGALLVGPPGTGKTLLAKATAGEAGVPFLSISGSDFMEMFVGVGPARVRDLFAQARAQAPSIIFIDEIDAIGRARGRAGMAGGNDERENTLNQLLVEMDGFPTTANVVVLAGTNRPDILDKALLRPGRFDRQISLDRPDINGREQIFRVHLAKIRLDAPVDAYSERLAALTPGFAGADIANVCNEAALIAARGDKAAVGLADFEAAVDRVIGGLEKKHKVISPAERRTVAYHEAGHAVVGWFLENAEPLLKVSIVPRGAAALGFAQYLPNENSLMTTQQMDDMMAMALGGRAAEEVMLGRISTGAQNDLERVTRMAYSQVAVYGMNAAVGLLSFPPEEGRLHNPYSEDTGRLIDREVRALVDRAYLRTVALLKEKRGLVEAMAQELLAHEVLGLEALERVLGARPFEHDGMRNIDKYRGSGAAVGAGSAAGAPESGVAPAGAEGGAEAPPPPPPSDTPAGEGQPAFAAGGAGGPAAS